MIFESPLADVQDTLWRAVIGSDGGFEVSNQGDIRKVTTGQLVKLSTNTAGYRCCGVSSFGERKVRKVHIMVAEAFIGPRLEGHEVAFKDGIKANCRLSNLRYGTPKEHAENRIRDGFVVPSAKLNPAKVLEMRKLINDRVKFEIIAEKYGVSYGTVKKVSQRLTWTHI